MIGFAAIAERNWTAILLHCKHKAKILPQKKRKRISPIWSPTSVIEIRDTMLEMVSMFEQDYDAALLQLKEDYKKYGVHPAFIADVFGKDAVKQKAEAIRIMMPEDKQDDNDKYWIWYCETFITDR